MQLTPQQIDGKQCPGQSGAMEAVSNAVDVCERSPKGQVKRPNRPEHVRAFEFLKVNYEEDVKAEVPIQKSDVYIDYQRYCAKNKLKPLVAADFGRILKSVFPNAKDRRLGSRGCSKYCYVGVKRRARSAMTHPNMAPCSPEDICKACEYLICEWASTVLSRKIRSTHELAKYLLKNRFVQTRSCAALTLTASLGETGELVDPPPVNKHRETQLKLQEKLRERLLDKQKKISRTGSLDDSELSLEQQSSNSHLNSSQSTPEPEQGVVSSSAPGSSRASPEQLALSVSSSRCTSPVNGLGTQKLSCLTTYQGNGFDALSEGRSMPATPTPAHSQCESAVSSERTTPIGPLHTNSQHPSNFMYDPRIQSCPSTPLNSYQHTFDFPPQPVNTVASSQCLSLPNSARNTPVLPDYEDTNAPGYRAEHLAAPQATDMYQNFPGHQFSQNPNLSGFQRVEFNRTNSAFIPIRDCGVVGTTQLPGLNRLSGPAHAQSYSKPLEPVLSSESDELEINEILDIIEKGSSGTLPLDEEAETTQQEVEERIRSLSAQGPITQGAGAGSQPPSLQSSQGSSNTVLYNLLLSGPNHNAADTGRFRHHSGPQLGYAASHKSKQSSLAAPKMHPGHPSGHLAATAATLSTSSSGDIYSPPSTPNGNFRPVHDPSREMRMYYGNETQHANNAYSGRSANSSPAGIAVPSRLNNSLVGTMSPPTQPLKRKRNISGERVQSTLVAKPHTATKPATSAHSDYIAKRSLGGSLSSPVVFNDGSQSNGSRN
ncbi:DNA-binding protein RFX7-like isoform X2 [Watersipora subatra]|uniref:DNA-binding protein RFX7-like isoform X2 n=1 Tax=Watersipora subatra TaxID=2589382 RepID=UPI00355B31CE